MENNEPLKDALSDLEKKGYKIDLEFEVNTFALYGGDLDMRLDPEEFHVDAIDRVGSDADGDNGAIIYAISTEAGIKGVIVDRTEDTKDENDPPCIA